MKIDEKKEKSRRFDYSGTCMIQNNFIPILLFFSHLIARFWAKKE